MTTFTFNKANLLKAKEIIAKYPAGRQRSAILPLLEMAQRQNNNWLSKESIEYVADMIQIPHIRAYEVVTFYTMFNTKPVGKYHLQVCGTTPCWLRGAADVMNTCEKHLKIKCGETTKDGLFTLSEVECLGACVDAPIVQINDDFFENVTPDTIKKKLDELK
jgi:NADH-quinone oxidoreductase subunit E